MNPPDSNDGYIGHKVAALVVSGVPVLAQLDPNNLGERLVLAGCGGLGSLLVLISDRPKGWYDFVSRVTGGVTSCFLFGPWVATRTGQDTLNGLILTFGLMGAASWYVLGSATKGMIAFRESAGFWTFVSALTRGRIQVRIEDRRDPPTPSPPTPPGGPPKAGAGG